MSLAQAPQTIENLAENLAIGVTVSYDPEKYLLTGRYADELSAHRAKKVWIETLEQGFLLEANSDIKLNVIRDNPGEYSLVCRFTSACGRYAFWRLTNRMVPEAEYLIETAHIPPAPSRAGELAAAADMTIERQNKAINTHFNAAGLDESVFKSFRKALLKLLST